MLRGVNVCVGSIIKHSVSTFNSIKEFQMGENSLAYFNYENWISVGDYMLFPVFCNRLDMFVPSTFVTLNHNQTAMSVESVKLTIKSMPLYPE